MKKNGKLTLKIEWRNLTFAKRIVKIKEIIQIMSLRIVFLIKKFLPKYVVIAIRCMLKNIRINNINSSYIKSYLAHFLGPTSTKLLIFHEGTFWAWSKENPLWKNFLYFKKCNFPAPRLKNSYISGGNLQSPKIKSFLFFLKIYLYIYFSSSNLFSSKILHQNYHVLQSDSQSKQRYD